MGGADFFVFQNSNDPKYQLSKNADLSLKKSLFSTNATFPFSLVQNTCIKAHKLGAIHKGRPAKIGIF